MTERAPAPAPLRQDEMEGVLRAKLLVPERSLKNLHKKFSQVVSAKDSSSLAHHVATFQLELDSYIFQLKRIHAVAKETTVAEVNEYHGKIKNMDEEKEQTLHAIESLKEELVQVQQERKNKLEYDQLASEIMHYGTRDELESQLTSLKATIDSLVEESSKYSVVMLQSKERFEKIADELEKLRADVGFEVGERERREVEREGEGDAEDDVKGDGEVEASATAAENNAVSQPGEKSIAEGLEKGNDSKLRLNPAAAVFRPTQSTKKNSVSSAESNRESSQKRRRAARRSGQDEEDEEDLAKKRAREEGEMSEVEGEDDEESEEGAA